MMIMSNNNGKSRMTKFFFLNLNKSKQNCIRHFDRVITVVTVHFCTNLEKNSLKNHQSMIIIIKILII